MAELPDLPGPFIDDAGTPVSAADVNTFLRLALEMDSLSYRRMDSFDSTADQNTACPGFAPERDYRAAWYGLPYVAGMTQLVIEGSFAKTGSAYVSIRINGAERDTITANGAYSKTITVSSADAVGNVIEIELFVKDNTSKSGGVYVSDCYGIRPVLSGWGGVPTFGPTYQASEFVQLANALQWEWDYISSLPRPAFMSHQWAFANVARLDGLRPLYAGGIGRYYANDILRIYGRAHTRRAQERFVLFYNGNRIDGPTWTPGSPPIGVTVPLTHMIGTRAKLEIFSEVLATGPTASEEWQSNYTFDVIRSEADGSGYPTASSPAYVTPYADIAQATLSSTLQQICDIVESTHTRLVSNSAVWGRVRAMRRRYGWRPDHDSQIYRYAPRLVRSGNRLTVRGKGVKLLWGPLNLETPLTKNYTYEGTYSQEVCAADKLETKVIYLDTLKTLDVGSPYYLLGDVTAAWEDSE